MIVGLGNPGIMFKDTYHNAGALAVEYLAREFENGGEPVAWKARKKAFRYAAVDGCALVLPLTFMNESGAAVKAAMKKFSAEVKDITLIHDESDVVIGTYKVSTVRNAAGHKGVTSVMDALGAKDFTRIRIGIRPGGERARKQASAFFVFHQ